MKLGFYLRNPKDLISASQREGGGDMGSAVATTPEVSDQLRLEYETPRFLLTMRAEEHRFEQAVALQTVTSACRWTV